MEHNIIMERKRKKISPSLLLFEFRTITGNPYVHIFGMGLPVLLAVILTKAVTSDMPSNDISSIAVTAMFLGIGAIIPLATILIGYAATYALELEKGIPQRMELFGISQSMTVVNRIIAELIFQVCAFLIYFLVGFLALSIKAPTAAGLACYILCMIGISVISFLLAYTIALFFKKFGIAYCISMMLYFGIMIVSGMMGISYEMLPAPLQAVSKLLPTTYIVRDFGEVWLGREYNFMPMLQAFLFTGAVSGILLFLCLKHNAKKAGPSIM